MFVSVGSLSNDAESLAQRKLPGAIEWAKMHVLGTAWGSEQWRADVLQFNANGTGIRVFAAGLRNCVGMAVNPATGELWCSTNERDGLGDNLPPDYITRVQDGGFSTAGPGITSATTKTRAIAVSAPISRTR